MKQNLGGSDLGLRSVGGPALLAPGLEPLGGRDDGAAGVAS